jgi:transcriptional regulator with XRE-family HTH domain
MTRNEFCKQLLNCRKDSGIKMKDICFAMDTTERTVYRMESAAHNFSIDNVFAYLKAINYRMYIVCKNKGLHFKDRRTFASFLKKSREELGISQRDFAMQVGLSYGVITGIECENKNTAIDSILLIIEKLNDEILFKKVNLFKKTNNAEK